MSDVFDHQKITTAEDLLASLRKGNNQKLEIGLGELKVPCRLLSASEEAKIVVKAKQSAIHQNPSGKKQEVFESYETMKAMLEAATTVNGAPGFAMGFVDALTSSELAELYDQYVTINKMINPNIQLMKREEIQAIMDDVKKKKTVTNDYFSWQLAAVGKFFLEEIVANLPTDSEPGSQ